VSGAPSLLGSSAVESSVRSLLAMARTPEGRKKVRFASVSAVAIVVNQVTLFVCYLLLGWDKKDSVNSLVAAFLLSGTASYLLNRRWVWQRTGRSSFRRELAPFWGIGLLQLAISVPFVNWAQQRVEAAYSDKLVRTLLFMGLNLVIYAVMWVGKFVLFNRVLFADKSKDQPIDASAA
jgi:putative flippase GtrA